MAITLVVMKFVFLSLTAGAVLCGLHSCAHTKEVEEEKVEEVEMDKLVARVSSVNRSAGYVLIQKYGRLVIPEDSILYTLNPTTGGESTASIELTGEKLGQFLAADILSGELEVGDSVYLRNLTKEEPLNELVPSQPVVEAKKVSEDLKPKISDTSQGGTEQVVDQAVAAPSQVGAGAQGIVPLDQLDTTLLPVVEE